MSILSRVVGALQKPGALKLTLAVAAAGWGVATLSGMVQEKADFAEQVDQEISKRLTLLEELDARLEKAESRYRALLHETEYQVQKRTAAPDGTPPESEG